MPKYSKTLALEWGGVEKVCSLQSSLDKLYPSLVECQKQLTTGVGKGADFLGWFDPQMALAQNIYQEQIREITKSILSYTNAAVVVGIGGSLLGTKAVYEALTHSFAPLLKQEEREKALLFWAGHHLASDELSELITILDHYSPALIVVSKSGGTTEPALTFRILKQYFEQRYSSQEIKKRIIVITDPQDGILLKIAQENQYQTLPIPKNIGGRYSVFSAVGILPLHLAGIHTDHLLRGAQKAYQDMVLASEQPSLSKHPAFCYAGIRYLLYKQGYKIESLCTWSPKLRAVAQWWQQLFGESDGKEGIGLFPTHTHFTTDLHSMGQYFQQGERHLFASHLCIDQEEENVIIPPSSLNDGFEFLAGKSLFEVQQQAQKGTFLAHADGKLPTLVWYLPKLSEFWLGYWLYTNMLACGLGGYLLKINPFDQPGVEEYKKNMFALLGKQGYQEEAEKIHQKNSCFPVLVSQSPEYKEML
ncbi:MAG: glucose-6-phosphate isomerase [Silvanigrellaceae bacterium]|nr:glucose-6-phosphate isomerase [Silvanigrellaceae bacterium]